MTRFHALAMCSVLAAGCQYAHTQQELLDPEQPPQQKSVRVRPPIELSSGLWSVAIEIDIPTKDQGFVTAGSCTNVVSMLLATYQNEFANELQATLKGLVRSNAHCTISALSLIHAREVWVEDKQQGGPMALPSGAIVVLPCGHGEPFLPPEETLRDAPH